MLRLLDPTVWPDGYIVWVLGGVTTNDGGQGLFEYNPAATDADNGGTIFAPANMIGRWFRINPVPGTIFGRWFLPTGNGIADDYAKLNAAINAVPVEGGSVEIPPGTFKIGTGLLINRSNVTLFGSGLGTTTIVATSALVQNPDSRGTQFGLLEINSSISQPNRIENITVSDITFKQLTIAANFADPMKVVFYSNVDNIEFSRVGIINGNAEALSSFGITGEEPNQIRVLNCYFAGCQFTGFDLNATETRGVVVDGCSFVSCWAGVLVIGREIVINGNTFKNCVSSALMLGELQFPAVGPRLGASAVTNNVIDGTGTGGTAEVRAIQITNAGGRYSAGAGVEDTGLIVANNSIRNTIKNTGGNCYAIHARGCFTLSNNVITGFTDAAGGESSAIYLTEAGNGGGTLSVRMVLNGNVVDETNGGDKWDIGLQLANNLLSTTRVYLSDNKFFGQSAQAIYAVAGCACFLSLNGDRIKGIVQYVWGNSDGNSWINQTGAFDYQPLTGNSDGLISCPISPDIGWNINANGGATPSVKNLRFVLIVNAAPQNITGLDTTVAAQGQEVTLYFADGNSTLVDSGTFRLAGTANVTPTTGSMVTMIRVSTSWAEKCRAIR